MKLPAARSLTDARFRQLIAKGETENVELKGRGASTEDIVATVVCMANGPGGIILWGVEDGGMVQRGVRLKDPASFQRTAYHSTSPSQLVEVQLLTLDESRVLAIWVRHSPVLVSTTGGAYLQRVGTECVPMTPDRLIVRQIDTRALDFSAALTPVGIENIDDVELTRYRLQLPPADGAGPQLRDLPPAELLAAIGATALAETGAPLLTVAGLLVFGGEDVIRQTLPQHQVVYLRTLSGTTDYERRVVSSAPLLRLVDVLMTEITAASRVRTLRLGRQDIEVPDYPERVLREAIVNAIAHRHYTVHGDTVIRQSAVALEIESPGGFPEGVTADTIIQHAPVHRNRLLCEILDRVRYMERSGLGVDRIYEDQLRFGKRPPTYDDGGRTRVRLRLDASEFDESFARFVISEEQAGRRWRVEELLTLSHLRQMGPSDRSSLARVMQRSEDESQEVLSALLGDTVDRFGSGLGLRYALSARVQAALGAEAAYTRERGLARKYQRGIVLQHARQFGRVDNKTVRELLQVSIGRAASLLNSMEAHGELEQRGQRRWAYYVPGTVLSDEQL
jgi:ATP-dependent DNA helicase RecG